MNIKKYISFALSAALAASAFGTIPASAEKASGIVISRGCPAYSLYSSEASYANDPFYYTFWTSEAGDYLAYDLSAVPQSERRQVLAVWYNATEQYDAGVVYQDTNGVPGDYTIEVNPAAGGSCPESGWKVVDTVKDNTLHSRQHLVDMSGYNWIRINVSKADGSESGSVSLNFDIHNASDGAADSWIFFGDSITAGSLMNCYGTSFAEYVNRLDPRYFPVQENGGIGGISSTDGRNNIDRWLSTFPGKYVSIAYGTNDAWGDQTGAEQYYENTAYMVERIIDAGKVPIVPKIPYSTDSELNIELYNAQIDKLYRNYPSVVKGPDFYEYFRENPGLLSGDGVHPDSDGYDGMRQLWADVMYKNVYSAKAAVSRAAVKGDINGDGAANLADLILLGKFLTRQDTLEAYQNGADMSDLNDDGKTNVMDWIILKRQLSGEPAPGEVTSSAWKAVSDNVKLQGRNVIKNGTTWLVQSGSAAEFYVTGDSASVVLEGDDGINNGDDYRPRYAVYVDDKLIADALMDSREKTIELFSTKSSSARKVKVILLSEAMYGGIGVKSINVNSDIPKPVKPLPKNKLNIEFIGDSITCAYGVEGKSNGDSFKTSTENFTKSYAYLTAQKLGADYSACCYSGHGIISGYTTDGKKNTEALIPDCYDKASKWGDYGEEWDFSADKKDAVIINLGTNDSSYICYNNKADEEKRSKEFIENYVKFLKIVREKNSKAYIICTLGTMDFENVYNYVDTAVGQYKAETNDSRVMFYQSVQQSASDGYGSDWHPSEVTQKNISYVLTDKICTALGIESDQVGLDVAAESEYVADINNAGGANAASFVGYDKSFWINTVTGGSSPDDIKAVIRGIGMKAGGDYRLEFDYTSSKDYEMPVRIITGTGNIVFETSVNSGSEKKHFSEEFSCRTSDANSSIEFLLGGYDSCNTTLSSIKLVKIK